MDSTVVRVRKALQARWPVLWRFLLATLVAQSVYWLAVEPFLHRKGAPDTLYPILMAEAAELPIPDLEALSTARFEPVEIPWYACCEPSYQAIRFTADIDTVDPSGAGFLGRINADNAKLYVNGRLVHGQGSMDLKRPSTDQIRDLWFVPPAMLQSGRNTFTIVTARSSQPYTDIGEAWIGPYNEIEPFLAFRVFMFDGYYLAGAAIGSVLSLLAITIFLRGGRSASMFWVAILLMVWSGRVAVTLFDSLPFPPFLKSLIWMQLELTMSLCWLNFANEWTQRPFRPIRNLSVAFYLVASASMAWVYLNLPSPDGFDTTSLILAYTGLTLTGTALVRFAWHVIYENDDRIAEAAVFTLFIALLGYDFGSELFFQRVGGQLTTSFPLIIVAFAVAFLSRNIHLFRSMNDYNSQLATDLAAREREISNSFAQRQEVNRQQALLAERQRIMRDMHDGMGGRLMSIAAQLRNQGGQRPGTEQLADELMEALDELRLIVDSLDTAGDDLGMALGAFRNRMERKLSAAGVKSEWAIDDEAANTSLSASAILDIYRIMQEACANMLRYSGADHFSVALKTREDGAVVLEMSDNGKGLDEEISAGKGMTNMRSRAARLGGYISFFANTPGLKISLVLPPAAPAQE